MALGRGEVPGTTTPSAATPTDLGDDPDGDIEGYDGPVAPGPIESQFLLALESLINRHSVENESDTPDFILAQYLRGCLDAWNKAVRERDRWYGHDPWPNKTAAVEREEAPE